MNGPALQFEDEIGFSFNNSFAELPHEFYAKLPPVPVRQPKIVAINDRLAKDLLLNPRQLDTTEGANILSGNRVPAGADPLAMVYAGHQFGNWVPQLGDGRAILLGEIVDRSGIRQDVQLKGSGPTPYSRRADGRAWLGPVLREYLVSEAMHALGIPTTRALAAVTTGEPVYRETALPGAVLTRVARSLIRVGTFQYFYARNDTDALRSLLGYVINRLYPAAHGEKNPALSVLRSVVAGQARLIAQWMSVGFIHGVMNTDNMSIACETIDFGPCAFLDEFTNSKVFSSIDIAGRYAYANQPDIGLWNLAQFATALLPMISDDVNEATTLATEEVNRFRDEFSGSWAEFMGRKIGFDRTTEGELELLDSLLTLFQEQSIDFTIGFRTLANCAVPSGDDNEFLELFGSTDEIRGWLTRWRSRLDAGSRTHRQCTAVMREANPAIIPRNHQIEHCITEAVNGDFDRFFRLNEALSYPYEDRKEFDEFRKPPQPAERVQRTFCGT